MKSERDLRIPPKIPAKDKGSTRVDNRTSDPNTSYPVPDFATLFTGVPPRPEGSRTEVLALITQEDGRRTPALVPVFPRPTAVRIGHLGRPFGGGTSREARRRAARRNN